MGSLTDLGIQTFGSEFWTLSRNHTLLPLSIFFFAKVINVILFVSGFFYVWWSQRETHSSPSSSSILKCETDENHGSGGAGWTTVVTWLRPYWGFFFSRPLTFVSWIHTSSNKRSIFLLRDDLYMAARSSLSSHQDQKGNMTLSSETLSKQVGPNGILLLLWQYSISGESEEVQVLWFCRASKKVGFTSNPTNNDVVHSVVSSKSIQVLKSIV